MSSKLFLQYLIQTARDFPDRFDEEIIRIASLRTDRAKNMPCNPENGNFYVKTFSHMENGKPIFKWENWR